MPGGYLQEKFESIPGNETNTPTLSTKVIYPALIEYDVEPGTNPMERDDELRNVEEPQSVLPEQYAPSWSGRGRAYPDHLGWRLKHILGPPTTTAGNGVITDPDGGTIPVGAYRHQWISTSSNWGNPGISPLTVQMIAAWQDQAVFMKLKGAACDALGIDNPETGGTTISASGPALYLDDGIADPALSPVYESPTIRPFSRGHLSLPTWLTGSGNKTDFNLNIASAADRVFSLGAGSKWADVMEKGEGITTITGSVALHQIDPQDLAALRASTGFAVKAKWLNENPIAATSYKYTLWLEGANAQYTAGKAAALTNSRRRGGSFDFKLTSAGSGAACTITLINGTASYA